MLTALATPEILQLLVTIKAGCIICGVVGCLFAALGVSMLLDLHGWGSSPYVALLGLLLIATSVIGNAGVQCCIDGINENRPFNTTPASEYHHSTFQPIASLKDNSITNAISGKGTFILGCGGMVMSGGNTIPVYVFYKRMSDNEFVQDSIPSEGVFIREDADTEPSIEWIYLHTTNEKITYLDNGETHGGLETDVLEKTVIHVPVGTIISDYSLDSEI